METQQRFAEQSTLVLSNVLISSYVIIKRRIAWLLGRWLSDECTSPNNPVIWEILIHFITDRGTGSDIAVRLASATALMECVNVSAVTGVYLVNMNLRRITRPTLLNLIFSFLICHLLWSNSFNFPPMRNHSKESAG